MLWSRSGGYCQNPSCNKDFFIFFNDGHLSDIEELAHIIGKSENGPRGESKMSIYERDLYDNIILLCPNCHTLIDKNPEQFSVVNLRNWKTQHELQLKNLFSVPNYNSRVELSLEFHKIIMRNEEIFREYGPHSIDSINPLSDSAIVWKRYIQSDIIPNNRKIVFLLQKNNKYLLSEERKVFSQFVLHQEAFEYNHISGDKSSSAPLFPSEMKNILKD